MPSKNKKTGTSKKSTVKTESTTDVAPTDRLANPTATTEPQRTQTVYGKGITTSSEGNKHTMVVHIPPHDPDKLLFEADIIDREAYFDQFGSQLILNGWSALESVLREMRKLIQEFNAKCEEEDINYILRWGHQTKSRNRTYIYCGSYIYEKKDGKEIYVRKYTARDWRLTLGEEAFKLVGQPPKLEIDNIRFRRVTMREKETGKDIQYNSIIMPNGEYYRYRKYFANLPAFQLG